MHISICANYDYAMAFKKSNMLIALYIYKVCLDGTPLSSPSSQFRFLLTYR